MGTIGTPELIIIVVILIIIFGLGRLPQIGRGLGEAIRDFRQNIRQDDDIINNNPNALGNPPKSRVEQLLDELKARSDPVTLGIALNKVLDVFNISLYQLANDSGIDRATLSRICNGTTKKPRKETLTRILDAFPALPSGWRDDFLALAGYPAVESRRSLPHPLQVYLSCHGEDLTAEKHQVTTDLNYPRSFYRPEVGESDWSVQEVTKSIHSSDYLVMVQGWRWLPVRQLEADAAAEDDSVSSLFFQKEGLTLQQEAQEFKERTGDWTAFTDSRNLAELVWIELAEKIREEARAGRARVSLHNMVVILLVSQLLTAEELTLTELLRRLLNRHNQKVDEAATAPAETTGPVEVESPQLEQAASVDEQSLDRPGRLKRADLREPEMITIPAGRFWMGTDRRALERAGITWQDWMDRETPARRLYLPAYAIGRYPVTNREYAAFIQDKGYSRREFWTDAGWQWREKSGIIRPRYWDDEKWNQAECPVVGVSWYEVVAYCGWLTQLSGRLYRLPTEAEWEKASRGPNGYIWPWGNRWESGRCNSHEGGQDKTTPVGQYSPAGDSPYHVADMVGNVWEWCVSKSFKSYPYNVNEDEWAGGYQAGTVSQVLRGGSWSYNRYDARCAYRLWGYPSFWDNYFGFRLVSPI